ncbi:uncharacterized protein FPRO_11391 [Fusarium proliferatum ET1]|uniref:Uncharacterized protein n=1 Tax=Fusarium proliferatum (strain ET1) TaxID=1227346 RepID=A0A1L7VZW1_FUSPR|nr:uncharacterized protein FPRO_11391 [Fusarium proliferatum ET1]CZR45944.1 uncharacterized protein FPRO_11391 [Fusarium proliferatum ET1]
MLQPTRCLIAYSNEPAAHECSPQSNSNNSLDWTAFDDLSEGARMTQRSRDATLDIFHPVDMENVRVWNDSQESSLLITSSSPNYEETIDHMMAHMPLGSPPFVNQILLSQTLLLSDSSLTLGYEECEALGHYHDGFCLAHTYKLAAWSFPVFLLRKISYSSVAIRCALAVSL